MNTGRSNHKALKTSWTLILLPDLTRETYDVDDHQDGSFLFFLLSLFLLSNDTQPKVTDTTHTISKAEPVKTNPIQLTVDNRGYRGSKGHYRWTHTLYPEKWDPERRQKETAEQNRAGRGGGVTIDVVVRGICGSNFTFNVCVSMQCQVFLCACLCVERTGGRRHCFWLIAQATNISFLHFHMTWKPTPFPPSFYHISVTNHISSILFVYLHRCK